jgi:hypothetical protein
MLGDEEYNSVKGLIVSDYFICDKSIDLFWEDDPFECCEYSNFSHMFVCPKWGKQFCDDCNNQHKGNDFSITCRGCYDGEHRSRMDLDICNVIIFVERKHKSQKRKKRIIPATEPLNTMIPGIFRSGCFWL